MGDDRPWWSTEPLPTAPGEIAVIDVRDALLEGWGKSMPLADEDEDAEYIATALEPYGLTFPGLASSSDQRLSADPWDAVRSRTELRIGLVAAERAADIITVVGWHGAVNVHAAVAPMSAILRSWEDRFGAEVVQIGFATLTLLVERPPMTVDHALATAAEHYAFCPDNVDQGTGRLRSYAESLVRAPLWEFWWD